MTSTTTESAICSIIGARDREMRADLASWVAIPTGHNHIAGLDELRAILVGRLEALGAETELVAGDPRPAWLLNAEPGAAIPPCAVCRRHIPGRPRLLLVGHLDTVFHPSDPFNAMAVSEDGATATGPGVVDMKGGLLVAVAALEALERAGVECSWTFALNSDEETGTFFSNRVLEREAARHDYGLVFEPALPDGSLAIERKGSAQFMIEAHGKSAHAGRDFDKGVSAVYALAHVLTRVEGLSDAERGVTLNVGPLEGGAATNAVPDRARAWGNARFRDDESARKLEAELDALATGGESLPRIVMHHTFNRPAKPRTPEVERFAGLAREVAESLGQSLPFASTGGVCDGNILQHVGLPTLDTLGVRGGGLHTREEWIDLSSLVERAQLVACLIARLNESTSIEDHRTGTHP